jgi:hypothetical protein
MLQRRGKQSSHTLSASAVSMWHSWAVANRNWTVLVDRIDSITLDWRMIRCARAAFRVRLVGCSSPFWSTDPTLWRSISRSSYTLHNKQGVNFCTRFVWESKQCVRNKQKETKYKKKLSI